MSEKACISNRVYYNVKLGVKFLFNNVTDFNHSDGFKSLFSINLKNNKA